MFFIWSRWPELNRRPTPYHGVALPSELQRRREDDTWCSVRGRSFGGKEEKELVLFLLRPTKREPGFYPPCGPNVAVVRTHTTNKRFSIIRFFLGFAMKYDRTVFSTCTASVCLMCAIITEQSTRVLLVVVNLLVDSY